MLKECNYENKLNLYKCRSGISIFDKKIENLPHEITHMILGYTFNQPMNLPPELTRLTLGYNFSQPVNLPNNLTHLTLGYKFSQPVNLPNITYLKIPSNNAHNIIDFLQNSLEELILSCVFNLQMNNLPNGLKKLIFEKENYEHELNSLPNSLEYIKLPLKYKQNLNFPKNLNTIECAKYYPFIENLKKHNLKIKLFY